MQKRLILVYNPRSSHHKRIEEEVLAELRNLSGWMIGKYSVKKLSLDQNAEDLVRILADNDLLIVAGGDGTASMALNAVISSGKKVRLGVLGYGNFNDFARMLGGNARGGVREIIQRFETGETKRIYPLEVKVNGEHWRYVACYATLGLLAEATEMMDEPAMREALNSGKHGPFFSLFRAIGWYFKHRKKSFLPAQMTVNGRLVKKGTTDYLAVNGAHLAGLMRGGKWYLRGESFGSATKRLGGFWRMVGFGLRSVFWRMKLAESKQDVIEFPLDSAVEIQAEGEYCRLNKVSKVEIRKMIEGIEVL